MDLTSDDVHDVLRLLDALPYDELRLETDRFTLTLRRTPGGGWTQEGEVRSVPNVVGPATDEDASRVRARAPTTTPPTHVGGAPSVDDCQDPDKRLSTESTGSTGETDGLLEVRAPLLGTFYRAPKPGAAPFVEVGSLVEEDTVVGLVETMKLFTSVYARVRGTVAEVCLADAQFAHEGAVLMRVAPEGP